MTFFIDISDQRNKIVKYFLELDKRKVEDFDLKNLHKIYKDDIIIFAPNKKFSKEEVQSFPNQIKVVCGNINKEISEIFQQKQIEVLNLMEDEIFAIKNSHLTSEGILSLIISSTDYSIFEAKILILGYGRVGKTTAKLFDKLGLEYSIVSHSTANFASSHLFNGRHFCGGDFLNQLKNFDIIINTIPAKIIDESYYINFKINALYLEISSIESLNIEQIKAFTYLPCPALPQKFSSFSAGKVMFEAIKRMFD